MHHFVLLGALLLQLTIKQRDSLCSASFLEEELQAHSLKAEFARLVIVESDINTQSESEEKKRSLADCKCLEVPLR